MPDDTATPAVPQPTPEVLALIPMWARAAVVLVPILGAGLGSLGGVLGGGQAVRTEQAVIASELARLKEDVRSLDGKIDRLTELVLRGDK